MDSDFFTGNRRALVASTNADVYILAGHVSVQRSADASYSFEQDANFWYLTGINEPGWRVVIENDTTTLIAPHVDDAHHMFDGSLSDDEALARSGADRVIVTSDSEVFFRSLRDSQVTVATLCDDPHKEHYGFTLNEGPVALKAQLSAIFEHVKDCRKDIATLRAIKQPRELIAIRNAIKLTQEVFQTVAARINSYEFEYEIEADFTHHFRRHGALGHAYDPIVASGERAGTLHYNKNDSRLVKDAFVLLDIGARDGGYAADITRTYAYGEVSKRHRDVHAEVERAHHQIIALLGPGVNVKQYSDDVDVIMHAALDRLGLLKQESDYRKYFPHAISHGLGIDVHDSLGAPTEFKPGMVLTVEPGIYIPEEGIGVRIEDDILITETGHENLSEQLPTSL